MSDIVLTALVITYNHERFIEEALDGILTQETDFEYEVIISEDCSTDRTREIIERIAQANPDRVRLLLSERNLNDNTVLRRGIEAARGRYLALQDGDDVWTAKDKLQKQVDFLESRPDCSMSFHNVRVVYDDGSKPSHPYLEDDPDPDSPGTFKPKSLSTVEDVVQRFFVPTCSAVFRTEHLRGMPDWYDGLSAGDHPLLVFAAEHGHVAYLDQIMAIYRVHSGGLWTGRGKYETLADAESVEEVFDALNRHLGSRFDHLVDPEIGYVYRLRAYSFYRQGQYDWAITAGRRGLARLPFWHRLRAVRLRGLIARARLRKLLGRPAPQ